MGEVREPSIVVEARAAVAAKMRLYAPLVAFVALGWLPALGGQYAIGDPAGTALFALYFLLCGPGVLGMMWLEHKSKWASEILKSWERSRADQQISQALRAEGGVGSDVAESVLMGRIREHLEFDARALRAAEEAHARVQRLRAEAESARQALDDLPHGEAREKLSRARGQLLDEAAEIESTLAALYATLLNRESQPTYSGLKNTLLELEAEVEVDQSSAAAAAQQRQKR